MPVPRKFALIFGTVVLLHLLFLWALNGGIGFKLRPAAPLVVMAEMVMLDLSPKLPPVAPATPLTPPPKAATPAPATAVASPAPVAAAQTPSVAPTPAPVTAPAAVAAVAAPAPTPIAAPAPPPEVRVAATLQASGSCQKPEYPRISQQREEEGVVKLNFRIGADGRVLEAHIEHSSGYPRLDEAARAGLSKCQFKPGTVDGKPEASWAKLNYRWNLN